MKIGILSPPWVPVPPPAYGGTESVIDILARGLAGRGHDVVLFATGDSQCPVPLSYEHDQAVADSHDQQAQSRHLEHGYWQFADRDIVHDHTLIGPSLWLGRSPVVVTMHGPINIEARTVMRQYPDSVTAVAISNAQRACAAEFGVHAVIHHGIEAERVPVGPGTGGYLLFVGRMSRVKGVHLAIEIARRSGWPLVIAAKMRDQREIDYFHDRVEPLLGPDVEFVGEAGPDRKLELLDNAYAVLNPIQWNEPFGLVMIEAMAAGTPVITTSWGAAPEIVVPGRTGFLCDSVEQAVAAVGRIGTIDRAACRRRVVDRFSADRMVTAYERLFAHVIARRAGEHVPRHIDLRGAAPSPGRIPAARQAPEPAPPEVLPRGN